MNKPASKPASRRFVLGCALAVLVVVIILHFVFCRCCPDSVTYGAGHAGDAAVGSQGAGDGTRRAALVDSAELFTISGNTTEPISPGVRAPLDLRLTNPHAFALTATGLRVSVQKVSAPNADNAHPCTIGDFAVDQASSDMQITVAARATSTLSNLGIPRAKQPHVGMLNRPVNQDGCKGASLTLAYTASGTLEN
jgi:hypothetical protein